MQKRMFFILSVLLVIFLAGTAQANRFDSFEPSADCDGWSVVGAAKIGQSYAPGVDISYTVSLIQDGTVLDEQSGTVFVGAYADPDPFSVSGSFDNLPSGPFEISGFFSIPHPDGEVLESFNLELSCAEAATAKRPAFWRRHPEVWPVDSIEIGGISYTKTEAREMMRGCFRHRVIKRLFRHTLAAKLNVANGVPGEMSQLIADADFFLASHDFHSRQPRSERRDARALKNELREFNRGDSSKSFDEEDKDFDDFAEETSLDQMKAMFR